MGRNKKRLRDLPDVRVVRSYGELKKLAKLVGSVSAEDTLFTAITILYLARQNEEIIKLLKKIARKHPAKSKRWWEFWK